MRYDELITACINCINSFNPKIETEDSFAETFLKKVISFITSFLLYIVNKRHK